MSKLQTSMIKLQQHSSIFGDATVQFPKEDLNLIKQFLTKLAFVHVTLCLQICRSVRKIFCSSARSFRDVPYGVGVQCARAFVALRAFCQNHITRIPVNSAGWIRLTSVLHFMLLSRESLDLRKWFYLASPTTK